MLVRLNKSQKIQIQTSEDAFIILKGLLEQFDKIDQEKEHLYVIGLTGGNYIKYIDHVSMGSIKATIVEPREVFRRAIKIGVTAIIIGHNHPSGRLFPSEPDKSITKRLLESGKILDIPLLDHIIFSLEGHYSFLNSGELI